MVGLDMLLEDRSAVVEKYNKLLEEKRAASHYAWLHFWLLIAAGVLVYLKFYKYLDPTLQSFIWRFPMARSALSPNNKLGS